VYASDYHQQFNQIALFELFREELIKLRFSFFFWVFILQKNKKKVGKRLLKKLEKKKTKRKRKREIT
jgi:hypothetical protein